MRRPGTGHTHATPEHLPTVCNERKEKGFPLLLPPNFFPSSETRKKRKLFARHDPTKIKRFLMTEFLGSLTHFLFRFPCFDPPCSTLVSVLPSNAHAFCPNAGNAGRRALNDHRLRVRQIYVFFKFHVHHKGKAVLFRWLHPSPRLPLNFLFFLIFKFISYFFFFFFFVFPFFVLTLFSTYFNSLSFSPFNI